MKLIINKAEVVEVEKVGSHYICLGVRAKDVYELARAIKRSTTKVPLVLGVRANTVQLIKDAA